MPMLTGQRRRLHSGRWTLRTGTLAMVTAFAMAALAGPAHAGKISDTRSQIAAIEQQLNAFDMKLEASINAYDGARQHLSDVRGQIRENTIRLQVAKHNLKVAQAELSTFLVGSYKSDGSSDPAAYVLGSGSFTDLVNRVEYVQRVAKSEGDLLHEISTAEHQIAQRQAALKHEEAAATKLVAQRQRQKAQIESELHGRQQLLASVKGKLGREIAHRQAARDAAAKRRAAALAQQQQQSSPPPSSGDGGSSGGGGGGGGSYNPPPAGTLGQQAAALAQQYLGVPYVWGGASPSGFDCSGLVVYVYGRLGVSLPHYTFSLWNSGAHVSRDQLAPGDLVFFYSLEHVGIYIGGGLFVHAPHTGDVVKISSLNDPGYSSVYYGAVRIAG